MLILGIETCLASGLVFLGEGEKTLSSFRLSPRSSSSDLVPLIGSLSREANVSINRVDALVVTTGPGSFTGIRVGVSLAKSLSFSLNLPLVGVPTLDGIAFSLVSSGVVCSLIPAYRNSFFAAFFYKDGENIERKSDYLFLPFEEIVNQAEKFLPKKVTFAPLPKDCICQFKLNPNFSLSQEQIFLDKALLRWALKDIRNRKTVDPLVLKPIYVSSPIISRKRRGWKI